MRVPRWAKPVVAGMLLSVVAWGISTTERVVRLEQYIVDSAERLTRIENKLDKILQEKK